VSTLHRIFLTKYTFKTSQKFDTLVMSLMCEFPHLLPECAFCPSREIYVLIFWQQNHIRCAISKVSSLDFGKVEMSMVTSMPNISKTAGGSLQQIFSLDICLDFFAKITKIEPWEF
jgi:hypothetical protein